MPTTGQIDANERMKGYLQKIATGPRMSKDLSEAEAEDGLSLVLNGSVSPVRSALFLIAARMKLETVEENVGYWRALQKTTVRRTVGLDKLLQVSDPFDGFNRVPYFGFYTMPVLAAMGLPAYGHSSRSLPPKFGITFDDLLVQHYGVPEKDNADQRIQLLEQFRFGFLTTRHTNPALEALRNLREEIVKRPMLATLEKMLFPVEAKAGGNFLASGYFHPGYEQSMMAVARLSPFDRTVVGNGVEGTTLYGVHKDATVFIDEGDEQPRELKLSLRSMFSESDAKEVGDTYEELKQKTATLDFLAQNGEEALKSNSGPGAPLIATHAGVLSHLMNLVPTAQAGYDTAREVLAQGKCYDQLMQYISSLKK